MENRQAANLLHWREECSLLNGSPLEDPAAGIRAVARLAGRSETVRTGEPHNVAFPLGYTVAKPLKKASLRFGAHVVRRRARCARAKQQYAYAERKKQTRVCDQDLSPQSAKNDAAIVRRERQLWQCWNWRI